MPFSPLCFRESRKSYKELALARLAISTQDLSATSSIYANGDQHRLAAEGGTFTHFLIAGIDDQVGRGTAPPGGVRKERQLILDLFTAELMELAEKAWPQREELSVSLPTSVTKGPPLG